jgi:hypothetical protein
MRWGGRLHDLHDDLRRDIGVYPRAATDRLLSAPPENKSKKPASWLV